MSKNGRVTVDELELQFAVSPDCSSHGFERLDQDGVVKRTHGGAIARATDVSHADFSFSERQSVLEGEKRRMARRQRRGFKMAAPSFWMPVRRRYRWSNS